MYNKKQFYKAGEVTIIVSTVKITILNTATCRKLTKCDQFAFYGLYTRQLEILDQNVTIMYL